MNTLNNTGRTSFDSTYYGSSKHSSSNMPEYTLHGIDVYNQVMGLNAVYQTGMSYYHGDYSLPCTEVELSADGGTDEKLIKVNSLCAEDFEHDHYIAFLKELIDELALDEVKTIADLHELYIDVMDNNRMAQQYVIDLNLDLDADSDTSIEIF